jgi:hypothetical protein
MRIAVIVALLAVAGIARAQSLVDLTTATGMSGKLDANAAVNGSQMRNTITQKLAQSNAGQGSLGKGGWEDGGEGKSHGGTGTGGWASAKTSKTGGASGWAKGGASSGPARRR